MAYMEAPAMAKRKKPESNTVKRTSQLTFALRMGNLCNRFKWFLDWDITTNDFGSNFHSHSDNSSTYLTNILCEIARMYPGKPSLSIFEYVQSLAEENQDALKKLARELQNQVENATPSNSDSEAAKTYRKLYSKQLKIIEESAEDIINTVRDDRERLNLTLKDLPPHQDAFDLGRLIDQLAFPPFSPYQRVLLYNSWINWKNKPLPEDGIRQQFDLRLALDKELTVHNTAPNVIIRIQSLLGRLGVETDFASQLIAVMELPDMVKKLTFITDRIESELAFCDSSFIDGISIENNTSQNEERDKWINKQCELQGSKQKTFSQIQIELDTLAQSKQWERLESAQGVYVAMKRYRKRKGLDPLPARKDRS